MNSDKIKRMLDACYLAKRIRELLPELPEGVTPAYIQYMDVIHNRQKECPDVKVSDISEIFDAAGDIDTQIICASVRNPIHVTECAKMGADIATVPYNVFEQMMKHPLTDQGIEKFQADYKAVFGE